jgi:hypothetical protein
MIIPTVIVDKDEFNILRDAVHDTKLMICELIAPKSILKERVVTREPNEYWQNRLRKWVDVYHQRDDTQKFGDFQITTYDKPIEETAQEIIDKAGWQ